MSSYNTIPSASAEQRPQTQRKNDLGISDPGTVENNILARTEDKILLTTLQEIKENPKITETDTFAAEVAEALTKTLSNERLSNSPSIENTKVFDRTDKNDGVLCTNEIKKVDDTEVDGNDINDNISLGNLADVENSSDVENVDKCRIINVEEPSGISLKQNSDLNSVNAASYGREKCISPMVESIPTTEYWNSIINSLIDKKLDAFKTMILSNEDDTSESEKSVNYENAGSSNNFIQTKEQIIHKPMHEIQPIVPLLRLYVEEKKRQKNVADISDATVSSESYSKCVTKRPQDGLTDNPQYGYPQTLSSVQNNASHDMSKPVATQQGMYPNAGGMPGVTQQHHQSMGGPAPNPQPATMLVPQSQQIRGNPMPMQGYYTRNSLPHSIPSISRNPLTVVNQTGQQPVSQYGPLQIMSTQFVPQPTMIMNAQFTPQMYQQQRIYSPPQNITIPTQNAAHFVVQNTPLWQGYNASTLSSNNYFQSAHALSSYNPMPPAAAPLPAQLRRRNFCIIDPKTGKNLLDDDDKTIRPTAEKETDNTDPNICAAQVAATLTEPLSHERQSKSPSIEDTKVLDWMDKNNKSVSCANEIDSVANIEVDGSDEGDNISLGKKNNAKKKKDINKRGESKEGWEMDAFLDKGDENIPASTVPVTLPIKDFTSLPVTIVDSEILSTILLPGETLPDTITSNNVTPSEETLPDSFLQNDVSPVEQSSEASSVSPAESDDKENVDESVQNKMVLKYNYKEDQWSPLNPEGKKQYDRDFLLQLQSQPMTLTKPSNLPNLDIIKDKPHIQKLNEVNRNIQKQPPPIYGDHFLPTYAQRGVPRMPQMNRRSLQGREQKAKKIISLSHYVKLHEADDAWKPAYKQDASADVKDPEIIVSDRDETLRNSAREKKIKKEMIKLKNQEKYASFGKMVEVKIKKIAFQSERNASLAEKMIEEILVYAQDGTLNDKILTDKFD